MPEEKRRMVPERKKGTVQRTWFGLRAFFSPDMSAADPVGPDGQWRNSPQFARVRHLRITMTVGALPAIACGPAFLYVSSGESETGTNHGPPFWWYIGAAVLSGMIYAFFARLAILVSWSKERRDFLASEARQRAALHRLPPFAVLVLDGAVRRSIAGPVVGLLEALEGREVAIVTDPPALVFDEPDVEPAAPPIDLVRVRSGADAGREGRWIASLGPRRFEHGVLLEAAQVRFAEGPAVVPIGDLERFSLGPVRAE